MSEALAKHGGSTISRINSRDSEKAEKHVDLGPILHQNGAISDRGSDSLVALADPPPRCSHQGAM